MDYQNQGNPLTLKHHQAPHLPTLLVAWEPALKTSHGSCMKRCATVASDDDRRRNTHMHAVPWAYTPRRGHHGPLTITPHHHATMGPLGTTWGGDTTSYNLITITLKSRIRYRIRNRVGLNLQTSENSDRARTHGVIIAGTVLGEAKICRFQLRLRYRFLVVSVTIVSIPCPHEQYV